LRAVTIRDVARKAGVSAGLVSSYFGTKDRVVLALLDWVVANTVSLTVAPKILAISGPLDRLVGVIGQEIRATGMVGAAG
jgi:AcrR family transcriptional regulator